MQEYLFGNAEAGAADRSSHMRAMTVAIVGAGRSRHGIDATRYPPAEFGMGGADAGVDHIDMHTVAGFAVGVPCIDRQQALAGAVQTCGWRDGRIGRLDGIEVADLVNLDIGNARYRTQGLHAVLRDFDAEANECRRVRVTDAAPELFDSPLRGRHDFA